MRTIDEPNFEESKVEVEVKPSTWDQLLASLDQPDIKLNDKDSNLDGRIEDILFCVSDYLKEVINEHKNLVKLGKVEDCPDSYEYVNQINQIENKIPIEISRQDVLNRTNRILTILNKTPDIDLAKIVRDDIVERFNEFIQFKSESSENTIQITIEEFFDLWSILNQKIDQSKLIDATLDKLIQLDPMLRELEYLIEPLKFNEQIDELHLPDNLIENRQRLYKQIKVLVNLLEPKVIENIGNTGIDSIEYFKSKVNHINEKKLFMICNKLNYGQSLDQQELSIISKLETIFVSVEQFVQFLKDLIRAKITQKDNQGNQLSTIAIKSLSSLVRNYQSFIYSGVAFNSISNKADLSVIENEMFDQFIFICLNSDHSLRNINPEITEILAPLTKDIISANFLIKLYTFANTNKETFSDQILTKFNTVFIKLLESWQGDVTIFWESQSGKECYEYYLNKFISGFEYVHKDQISSWQNRCANLYENKILDFENNIYDKIFARAKDINDSYFLIKIVKSILVQSHKKFVIERVREPYDIEKFEKGLLLLRNNAKIRNNIYFMIEALQTDAISLKSVLEKLRASSMLENRLNLQPDVIQALAQELTFM